MQEASRSRAKCVPRGGRRNGNLLRSNAATYGGALLLLVLCSLRALAQAPVTEIASPRTPEQELASFELAWPELAIELVAAEPDVIDPVACCWDAIGALYVVEMHDYPLGPPSGRIKRLVDRDGDRHFEQVTVFADGLAFPNGALPYGDGLLVTAAPDIWFLADRDGDGRAEERRVVLTGFGEGNQQLRVNGLTWGLDGFVYGANGRSDGQLRWPNDSTEVPRDDASDRSSSSAINLARHDFRFRLGPRALEALAGPSQFGLAFDDFGQRFLSWNTIPLRHVVIEDYELARNSRLASASGINLLVRADDSWKLFPRSRPPRTFNRESVSYPNATCGVTIYRGDALPAVLNGSALVCEPLTNLVHRRILRPAGASFVAVRGAGEEDRDFLTGSDPWFRPVNLTTGPDGALYVVDFYRKWVEHPQFVPAEQRDAVDWRAGDDRGRIWRIVRRGDVATASAALRKKWPAECDTNELIALLDHANGWWRDTAQRLLVERRDPQAPERLREFIANEPSPRGWLHALWTWELTSGADEEVLRQTLTHENARVRAQGLRLATKHLATSESLREAALKLADDTNAAVRVQLALALAALDRETFDRAGGVSTLVALARQGHSDRWQRLAIESALADHGTEFLIALLKSLQPDSTSAHHEYRELVTDALQLADNAQDPAIWATAASFSPASEIPSGLVLGLAECAAGHGTSLQAMLKPESTADATVRRLIDEQLVAARATASDTQQSSAPRLLAVRLLAHDQAEAAGPILIALLDPAVPPELQLAAAGAIGELRDVALLSQALAGWDRQSIATRRALINGALRSGPLTAKLLEALETGRIELVEIATEVRPSLERLADEDLRRRAAELLAQLPVVDRSAVIEGRREALTIAGDRQRGGAIFAAHCATCHLVEGVGARVGPDLSGIAARPPEALMVDILDPSRDVPPDYMNYVVATTDGRVLSGLLAGETATTIALRLPDGVAQSVAREDVERLQATGKSLMPEGFEARLDSRQLADLLAFLAQPAGNLVREAPAAAANEPAPQQPGR